MAWTRPTLAQLSDRIRGDLEGAVTGLEARVRRKNTRILGTAMAGASHVLHGHLEWLRRQLFVSTCDRDMVWLHGVRWSIPALPAAKATGPVTVTASTGASVTAGAELTRSDGETYTVTTGGSESGGSISFTITAAVAGAGGDADAGAQLSWVEGAPTGVGASPVVAAGGLQGGADVEDPDLHRIRIQERIQAPPNGGADHDYERWAKEISGVTRVWVEPHWMGLGTVGVLFVLDGEEGADLIPNEAKVAEVQARIDLDAPVTARPIVVAPVATPIDFTLQVWPDTAAIRAAVEVELADVIRREAIPGGTIPLTHLAEAISGATGESDHRLVSPAADVVTSRGQLAVLGDVTWL